MSGARTLPTADELARVLDREPARRRLRRRLLAGAIGGAGLAGVALLAMTLREEPVAWRTEPVRFEDLRVVVTAVGTVEPKQVVSVGSQQSGIVHAVFVDEDEPVTAGQPLLALDPDLLSAQEREAAANVAGLRASLIQARAAERVAVTEQGRVERLGAARAVSPSEIDRARASGEQATAVREAAEAQLRSARARLALAATQLDRTVIRSPIDGVVLVRNIDPGQSVVASFQAVTLFEVAADLAEMTLEVEVDEADVPRVAPGQSAAFSVAAWPDREFRALVTEVHLHPHTAGGVVTYLAELSAENPDGALRPGMTVTARIAAEEHPDSTTVPVSALRFAPDPLPQGLEPAGLGQARLWRLAAGEPEPVLVTLGPTDGVRQAVLGPVQSGDAMIVGVETP